MPFYIAAAGNYDFFWLLVIVFVTFTVLRIVSLIMRKKQERNAPSRRLDIIDTKTIVEAPDSVDIEVEGSEGEVRHYSSFDELPEDIRKQIEEVKARGERISYSTSSDVDVNVFTTEYTLRDENVSLPDNFDISKSDVNIELEINGKKYHFDSIDEVPEDLKKYLPSMFRDKEKEK